jgi:hypothetical protein
MTSKTYGTSAVKSSETFNSKLVLNTPGPKVWVAELKLYETFFLKFVNFLDFLPDGFFFL